MKGWPPPLSPTVARAGLLALTAPRRLRFVAALERPEAAQRFALRRILRRVAGSLYGRRHGLRETDSYHAFQRKLPIVDAEAMRPWIDRQAETGEPLLSTEAALMYERTSGSSGRAKLVPYTSSLLSSFNAAFVLWVADLMAHGPPLNTGRIFFSVSPSFQRRERTPSGAPISLPDDSAYLSPTMQRLFGGCFFVPPQLKQIQEPLLYRRSLAAVLIAEARLEIMSVWSPTYLLSLLETIRGEREAILGDLSRGATGSEGAPIPLPPVAAHRLKLVAQDEPDWAALWPHLALLSCWTDGASAAFVPAIRQAFPEVMLQGKGLLATEGAMTFPLLNAAAPVPLLDELFLEFLGDDGSIKRLHELRAGEQVEVVLTQAGGLLRYRMKDRVQVEERCAQTPTLRFVGREGRTSDLVGEKLGEPFVRQLLSAELGGDGHCSFLVGRVDAAGRAGYRCVTDHRRAEESSAAIAARLDRALRGAFHYDQARGLGQLEPVELVFRADATRLYERILLDRGMSWGQIKFEALVAPPRSGEPDPIGAGDRPFGDADLERHGGGHER